MPFGRIQSLLCDEYCQFGDTVLIESPFAETMRDGRGLEQVQLGITPTKLIIAGDYIETMAAAAWCGLDPAVETLELLSLYPVELVNLSVFGAPTRQTLKARLANHVTRYFELGGLEKRRSKRRRWTERDLYLGSKRERHDAHSPTPLPGLGATAELKLLCVKPKSTQLLEYSDLTSKHCFRLQESTCGFEMLTYTGEPTSNITYTSITKAHRGPGYSTF